MEIITINHNQATMETTNTTRVEKAIVKAIDTARVIVMTAFAGMFGIIAFAALITMFKDFDFMNLLGIVGGAFCAWGCWDLRRE